MNAPQQSPRLNTREDPAVQFLGCPTLIRASSETTSKAFGLIEQWMIPPGFASPYHTHHLEDEAFYVLEGEVAFVCNGTWLLAGPGTYVYGPREIPHGFKIAGDAPARILILCAPAGFEHFVLEVADDPGPPDMARLMAVAAKYRVDLHGPLPEQPAATSTREISGRPEAAPADDHKRLNLRWIRAFNERDWEAETASRSPDFQAVLSGSKEPLDAAAWAGFMSSFTTAFPDARISVEACIAEGDEVVTRWTLTGTHRGVFQGVPPTGRTVTAAGIEFNHVAGGKIDRHWAQFDLLGLLQQIGAVRAE